MSENMSRAATWKDVEWVKLIHNTNPTHDCNIDLESAWADNQKESKTRDQIIYTLQKDAKEMFDKVFERIPEAKDSPKMLRAIAPITNLEVKFVGDPKTVMVDVPHYFAYQIDPEFKAFLEKEQKKSS